jgi:dihydrofolate synthase / folylpolyglutamate synthase
MSTGTAGGLLSPAGAPASRGKATVREIAAQKAGILPFGGRAVAARQPSAEVDDVLSAEAARRGCALRWVDTGAPAVPAATGPGGTELRLRGQPSLLGMRSATLPGRFERRVIAGRTAVLDGAPNPMKLAALVATLPEVYPGARFPRVLAFEQDKDLDAALRVVAPAPSVVVATRFCTGGGDHPASVSIPAERLAAAAADRGIPAVVERNPTSAVSCAAETDAAVPVVVSGSFHLLTAVHGAATVPP